VYRRALLLALSMAERDAKLFEIEIAQVWKHGEIDIILGKALRVLSETELFEPIRNLLHCGAPLRRSCDVQCNDIRPTL
jgi:hypothetical protein